MSVPEWVAKFSKACTIASFLASQQKVCSAWKLPVGLQDLAVFKYLLPDEVRFEYEDTPTDTVFDGAPDQVLIFGFSDKRARARKPESIRAIIHSRIQRFECAINQFLSRRGSLDNLYRLAASYIPPDVAATISVMQDAAAAGKSPVPHTSPEEAGVDPQDDQFESICSEIDNVLAVTVEPKREARTQPCPPHLLEYTGQPELWSHQKDGIGHLEADSSHHLVISTATASGKSLIFHSLVKQMLDTSDGTALLIYPTKALAQDQLRSFVKMSTQVYTFDGDTPFDKRQEIKQRGRVLLMNPDILHTTVLPRWKDWVLFLGNLRYVVLDELHYYGGIFGAHVACVLRRLRRLCAQLGADPCQFIGCSATLSDPKELMVTLTGLPPDNVLALGPDDDGSPSGAKKFVFCTPNFLTPEDPNTGRMHPIKEAAPLLVKMVRNNLRVIAFCRYRRECELLLRAVYEIDASLASVVRGYRGGYAPEDRRQIEALMFRGDLKGIVATTALEVGIDVGNLDAAIICGFPHSVASFRQQVGRVGRRQRDSLVVYVADGSVMDQHYAVTPHEVLHGPIVRAPIVLHESIVRSHIQAAAYEQALDRSDLAFFPDCDLEAANLQLLGDDDEEDFPDPADISSDVEIVEVASSTGPKMEEDVEPAKDVMLSYPMQPSINIRKADDERRDTVVIDADTSKVLEHVEYDRVGFTLYDGAIFVHQGKAYLVVHLDPDFQFAKVKRTNVKWVTRQRDYTDVDPLKTHSSKLVGINDFITVSTGQIKVTNKVFGYFKFDQFNQIIDCVDVQIPENVSIKSGLFVNIPHVILDTLKARKHHIPASIHAAEHVLVAVMPLFLSMSPGDVGTECKAPQKELYKKNMSLRRRAARLIFYERQGGKLGNGILTSAYSLFDALIEKACDTLENCDCDLGCGACIGSGYCVEQNAVLSKNGAKVILRSILMRDLTGIPAGPDPNLAEQPYETVVPVEAHTH